MTDQEMTEGLKCGDSEAFRALYAAYGSSVIGYLTRVLGRREMAEELTQDTFLIAIRKIGFFQPGRDGGLRAWMLRIATHRAIDVIRRERRVTAMPDDIDASPSLDSSPEEKLGRQEIQEVIHSALSRLTPSQRMIFLLKEQEDLSCMEISRVCGCSENAVKQILFRARKALRRALCD